MVMPFGKHKGEQISQIPVSYLRWVQENVEIKDARLKAAIKARVEGGEPEEDDEVKHLKDEVAQLKLELMLRPGITAEVIDGVYRTLAKKWHPDRGGNTAAMQALSEMKEELVNI